MNKGEIYEICGAVERIVYRNEENEYTVLEIGCEEESITAVGTMPLVYEGEELKLIGSFTSHNLYGQQFSVKAFERSMPTSALGIMKYLSGGAIKGIGPSTAARLVKEFSEKTLEVLENEPERVAKIKGISLEKEGFCDRNGFGNNKDKAIQVCNRGAHKAVFAWHDLFDHSLSSLH